MTPRKINTKNNNYIKSYYKYFKSLFKSDYNYKNILSLATNPKELFVPALLFVVLEIFINIVIIEKRSYTEIDWKAYMQEVEGVLNGTFDYSKLKGDTGPLVYPAGFVYIFIILYYITSQGINVKLGQYIFAIFHVILLVLVFKIYHKTKKVPPYVLLLIFSTSYRIHSIFVLRLFNDPVAMIFLYASINAFLNQKWYTGSILYSLAVSIKMNILLFSPALLLAYLTNLGLLETIIQLSICAFVQLILGLPFLLNNPIAYVKGAFNLSRIFEFKWTVNWRFLSEELFINSYFHLALLALHVLCLIFYTPKWYKYLKSYQKLKNVEKELASQLKKETFVDMSTSSQLFVLPMFMANFIGLVFSRSLHYQFYIWYYHTLPYLTWCCNYKTTTKLIIIGLVEFCWNTYPSTVFSSLCLHLCHIVLLYGLNNYLTKSLKSS